MASSFDDELSGVQKGAILLISLGPERSAEIFKYLKEDEIEDLTLEIANTRSVTPAVKEQILEEFYQVCLAQQYIAEGGIGYAKELLEKALGEEKAMDVIGKLTASLQVKPFEFIRKTEASQLLNFIQDEHPQTIALILSYLNASQAALIVSALPPDRQADVAKRIALMDSAEVVDAQVEREFQVHVSHRYLHARLFRGDGYNLLCHPVLYGRHVEQCGEYDEQQNGCEYRYPDPLESFSHSVLRKTLQS